MVAAVLIGVFMAARSWVRPSAVILVAMLAAGCASSGNSPSQIPTPTPTPAPTPTPTPAPTPTPTTDFRTIEYLRNGAAYDLVNVIPAYQASTFGARALVAIIDTGIDVNNPEFSGRIDLLNSADLGVPPFTSSSMAHAGGASLQDADGHGTAVAGIIAGARNDVGAHGIAPEARLVIFRGDTNDTSGDPNSVPTISGGAISEGFRRTIRLGADVLNLSLGSNDPAARSDFGRLLGASAAADIVVVLSAGNDGNADPDGSALAAIDAAAAGTAIISGALDATGQIASFSNRAGSGAEFYLAAPGVRVATTAIGGGTRLFSGTSASAPIVSGAAALLRDHWPQLSAAQTVDILLRSATDAGAPGTDPIFGRGILNIGAALAPLGARAASTASAQSVSVDGIGIAGSAALPISTAGLGDYVFLDSYGRDFRAPLGQLVASGNRYAVTPEALLRPNETRLSSRADVAGGVLRTRLVSAPRALVDDAAALRAENIGAEGGRDRLAVAFSHQVTPRLAFTAAQGFSPREIGAIVGDFPQLSTSARDGFADGYLSQDERGATTAFDVSLPQGWRGDFLASYATPTDDQTTPLFGGPPTRLVQRTETNLRLGLTARRYGGVLRFENGVLSERGGVLGAVAGPSFGTGLASRTVYQAVAADLPGLFGWRAQGRFSRGVTTLSGGGFLIGAAGLKTNQFAGGLYRDGLWRAGDRLTLSVSAPLRATGGAFVLKVPDAYDLETRSLVLSDRLIAVGGGAREIDLEASYLAGVVFGGRIEASVLRQSNAVDGRASTLGLLRAGWSF